MKTFSLAVLLALTLAADVRGADAVDNFIKLRDDYMDNVAEKVANAKTEYDRTMKSQTFSTKEERDRELRSKQQSLNALRDDAKHASDRAYLPAPERLAPAFSEQLQQNTFGRFPGNNKARIIQVVSDGKAIADVHIETTLKGPPPDVGYDQPAQSRFLTRGPGAGWAGVIDYKKVRVLLEDASIAGLADDTIIELNGIYEVAGTNRYADAAGAKRTATSLRVVDISEVKRRLAQRKKN